MSITIPQSAKEALSNRSRAYYEAHKGPLRERHVRYYAAHRAELSAYARKYRAEHAEQAKIGRRASYHKHKQKYRLNPKRQYQIYMCAAARRNLPFQLTYEQFMTLWQMPCRYCGCSIDNIGIDRIDNTKGYEIDNVGPCCKDCNTMKMALSEAEFVAKCAVIAKRFKR